MELYERNGNILYILNVLKRYTDENHLLSANKIAQLVEDEYNVSIDSRTVRRNINLLCDKFGIDIETWGDNKKDKFLIEDIW